MTSPAAPAHLFIDAAELQRRLGLTDRGFKAALAALQRMDFPKPDPLFEGKWFWPACARWLYRRYGLTIDGPTSPDIKGELDAPEDRRHPRPALAAEGRRKLVGHLARTG